MSLSNYPDGFGSASDWDHVEGPVSETPIEPDADNYCPFCGSEELVLVVWHGGTTAIHCDDCGEMVEAGEMVDHSDDQRDQRDEPVDRNELEPR